jgi:hypothetical protein
LSARLEHAQTGDLQVAVVRIGLRGQTLEVLVCEYLPLLPNFRLCCLLHELPD